MKDLSYLGLINYDEKYERSTWGFDIGLGYHLTK
jgi:hypothetical protein